MFTYQLQARFLHLDPGDTLTFPGQAEIEVHFGPPTVFGQSDAPSRVFIPPGAGREVQLLWNGQTGRLTFQSIPPLEPLQVTIQGTSDQLKLHGDVLRYECICNDVENLVASIHVLQYFFPAVLNVDFPEPPHVVSISGRVDGVPFRWLHKESAPVFTPISAALLEQFVSSAVERLAVVQGQPQRRLMASVHYFHVASRLLAVGTSVWEFMPEYVLNLCKALEVLCGNSRDEIRTHLVQLGYSTDDVEGDFIPLLLLRNHFDVGHPRLTVLNSAQLQVLYRYLEKTESNFRDLFRRVFARLKEGIYFVREPGEMRLDPGEQRRFDRLIESMAARLRPRRAQPKA
jgi:hypothetical protein